MQLTDNWTPEAIRSLIERRGVTQAQMAASLHVSLWTLKPWLSGRRKPNALAQLRLRRLESTTKRRER